MAIDTQAKRLSAISTRRLPWMRRFIPQPDGSMTIADRQQLAWVYGGIASSAGFTVTVGSSGPAYVFVQSVSSAYICVQSSKVSSIMVQSAKSSYLQTYE